MAKSKVFFKSRDYFNAKDLKSVEVRLCHRGWGDFFQFCKDLEPGTKISISARPAPGKRYKVRNYRFAGIFDDNNCSCCGGDYRIELWTCKDYQDILTRKNS